MGEKAGVPVFEMGQGDPHEIARRGVSEAKDHGYDIVLIDTAGRLQIDEELMDELERLKKDFANRTILVVDSLTGQEAVNVAETFNQRIGIDGVILRSWMPTQEAAQRCQCSPSPANRYCSPVPARRSRIWKSSTLTAWPAGSSEWGTSCLS